MLLISLVSLPPLCCNFFFFIHFDQNMEGITTSTQVTQLEEENERLRSQLEEATAQLEAARASHEKDLRQAEQDLTAVRQAHATELACLSAKFEQELQQALEQQERQTQEQTEVHQREMAAREATLAEKQVLERQLSGVEADMMSQRSQFEAQLKDKLMRIHELEDRVKEQQEQMQAMSATHEQREWLMKDKLQTAVQKLDQVRTAKRQLEAIHKETVQKHKAQVDELQTKIRQMTLELDTFEENKHQLSLLKSDFQLQTQDLITITKEYQALRAAQQELEATLQQQRERNNELVQDQQALLASKQALGEVARLNAALSEAQEQVANLQRQVDEMEATMAERTEQFRKKALDEAAMTISSDHHRLRTEAAQQAHLRKEEAAAAAKKIATLESHLDTEIAKLEFCRKNYKRLQRVYFAYLIKATLNKVKPNSQTFMTSSLMQLYKDDFKNRSSWLSWEQAVFDRFGPHAF
eukprot:m.221726 g.221726  ORF g.221726 m.221726 type:complete len:469 (-) comp17012_c0_seq27:1052-2458(-)